MTLYSIFFLISLATLATLLWPVRKQTRLVFIIGALFFIGAFGIYGMVGSPDIIPLLKERQLKLAELRETITRDAAAVKADPRNLKAWVELGQSFVETGQYGAAANAFKQAVKLSGGNPLLILAYARAMILEDGGNVSDAAKKSLEMVLLQDPENPDARYFIALRHLQDGHTETAMKEMKSLYQSLPKDSPLKEMIDRQIGRK